MIGRFIHSSETGVEVSAVPVKFSGVPEISGVVVAARVTVFVGSRVLVEVFMVSLYLGVGIVCSRVSVGVDVTVGIILVSAPQAVVNMETSTVKRKILFIKLFNHR